jgi:hypothetical protein
MAFDSPNNGLSVVGSLANTSMAAPAMTPSRSASANACSSTMPPRATLSSRAVGFILRSRSASMSPTVSGVFGRWTETKSARSSTSSTVATSSTPRRAARSGATKGS